LTPAVQPLFPTSPVPGNVDTVGQLSARPPVGCAEAAALLPHPPQSPWLVPVACIRRRLMTPTVCAHPFCPPARKVTVLRANYLSDPGYHPGLHPLAPTLQRPPHLPSRLSLAGTHTSLLTLAYAPRGLAFWARQPSGLGSLLQLLTLALILLPPRARPPLLPLAHRTATCAGVDDGPTSSSRGSPCLVHPCACQAQQPASLCLRFWPPPRGFLPLDLWVEGYLIPSFSPSRSLTNENPLLWTARNALMTAGAGSLVLLWRAFPLHAPASHRSGR
jgi:hypothetical protein